MYADKKENIKQCDPAKILKAHPNSVRLHAPHCGDFLDQGAGVPFYGKVMKWFKHESTAIKDEKIQMIIEKFGGNGYMLYFGLLELCAEKLDETLNPEVTISWVYSRKLFGINRTKVEQFLNYCSTIMGLSYTISEESYTVKIPNILKRLDNWTQDKLRTSKLLGSNLHIEEEQEEEQEKEEEINNPPLASIDPKKISLKDIKTDLSEPSKHKLYNEMISIFSVRGWRTDAEFCKPIFKDLAQNLSDKNPRELFPYFRQSLKNWYTRNAEWLSKSSQSNEVCDLACQIAGGKGV